MRRIKPVKERFMTDASFSIVKRHENDRKYAHPFIEIEKPEGRDRQRLQVERAAQQKQGKDDGRQRRHENERAKPEDAAVSRQIERDADKKRLRAAVFDPKKIRQKRKAQQIDEKAGVRTIRAQGKQQDKEEGNRDGNYDKAYAARILFFGNHGKSPQNKQ